MSSRGVVDSFNSYLDNSYGLTFSPDVFYSDIVFPVKLDGDADSRNDLYGYVFYSYGNIDSPRYNYAPADAFKIDGNGKLYSYIDYTGNSYGALRGSVMEVMHTL